MTIEIQQFSPNTSYIIAASTTTATQALTQPVNPTSVPGQPTGQFGNVVLEVYNANATKVAFFRTGMASVAATTASIYQVPPAVSKRFRMPAAHTTLDVILDSGASASNFYVMLGDGGA